MQKDLLAKMATRWANLLVLSLSVCLLVLNVVVLKQNGSLRSEVESLRGGRVVVGQQLLNLAGMSLDGRLRSIALPSSASEHLLIIGFSPGCRYCQANQNGWIDRYGKQIPSIFYGIPLSVRIAPLYYRIKQTNGRSLGSCSVLKASFHNSDRLGRFLNVDDGCTSHYQVPEERSCGSQCSGGMETWTFSDSEIADYCDGYAIDFEGCTTGTCREDY
jgi:hypothetical protein